jgi:hypothetical protein
MNILSIWTSRGVRFKLLTGTLLAIIPMLLIVYIAYIHTRDLSLKSNCNLLTMVDRYGSQDINSYLAAQANIFKTWTDKDIYGPAIESNDIPEIEDDFESMLQKAPGFSLLVLTDKNGKILIARENRRLPRAGTISLVGRSFPDAEKYIALDSRSAQIVPARLPEVYGDKSPQTVLYSSPAQNSRGENIGLFLAYLDWSQIRQKANQFGEQLKTNGFKNAWTAIIDANPYTILSHSSQDNLIDKSIQGDESLKTWLDRDYFLQAGKVRIDNRQIYLSYAPLYYNHTTDQAKLNDNHFHIYFAVFVPESDLLSHLNSMLRIALIIALISIIAGILAGIVLNRTIASPIIRVIDNLKETAELANAASEQVANASESLASGASQQASSLEETSSSLEEMAGMTRQNADNAQQASGLADDANVAAEKGTNAMCEMAAAMQKINESSNETAKIIKVIDEIAFQTNLLALNAAVEAARAGEAGKGFAVVAEEVRNLAMRSAEAANTTGELIEDSRKSAEMGVKSTDELTEIFKEINSAVKKVSDLIGEVSNASIEQAQGIEQINSAVVQMDQTTQHNAASAEESSSASKELASQAQQIQLIVSELAMVVYGGGSPDRRQTEIWNRDQKDDYYSMRSRYDYNTSSPYTRHPVPNRGESSFQDDTADENLSAEVVIPFDEKDMEDF